MTTRVRLSVAAQADIATILTTSQASWGDDACARYRVLLADTIERIAASPEGPLTRARSDIRPGYRTLHTRYARRKGGVAAPVHVVYYRVVRPDLIDILGVLHERMDPSTHFGTIARPRRTAPRR